MNKDYLEQKLREKAERTAFNEFVDGQEEIRKNAVLNNLFSYKGQFTILGRQLTSVYVPFDIETIEKSISKRTEKLYELYTDDMLKKLESIDYLFGGHEK
ncbi:hypothetical protein [Lactococcus lactis]|uniref:Uncharacterized protein n=1 Tax=Lactococcus lactis TaxID=1358 RepID=A0AAP8JD72_9LACT|nr:hypothetical protein [Lactococcus lactis]MDG4972308.1 hypothetical protein [Lactococcus lactis]PFG88456.1 hypothetical protein BW154_02885 [Lactococcus lactis]